MITNPRASTANEECRRWLRALLMHSIRVVLPEIADYEVRRELLRARRRVGVQRLDRLNLTLEYLPMTTEAMRLAADFWAIARQQGRPTADDRALDGDVILAAQARTIASDREPVIVATTNVSHLSRFVPAADWREVRATS